MSELPEDFSSLVELSRVRARQHPQRQAFTFLANGEVETAELSYRELDRQARAIGARLQQAGLTGERVLMLYPPGLEFIAAFLGCLYAGVVAVPAFPSTSRRTLPRLLAIAADARPGAVLTVEELRSKVEELTGALPGLDKGRCVVTDTLEPELAEAWQEPEVDRSTLAFLQYTSGSTSTPKGVMVSHGNLLANEELIRRAFDQSEESIIVGWLPVYHDMGLIGNILQPLYVSARCVLMSPVAFLQRPLRWLEAISRYRGTTSGGPNFAYELCVRKISPEERETLDLSSWRVAFNGAEPVRPESLARFARTFESCGFKSSAFYPCYGLAEATLFVTGGDVAAEPVTAVVEPEALERGRAEDAAGEGRLLAASGRSWGGQEVLVVDPERYVELPEGTVGEIWVAGPSVARGYWRRREATERDFGARLAGEENEARGPFLRTGDLGFFRAGELFVTGRIKDLIILRGRNLYPQDIELAAERSHPALRPGCGAAFALEVEGEERLVLVQEVDRNREEEAREAAEAIRRAVAEGFEAQVWEVVLIRNGTVPKTSSGKIQRRACHAQYVGGELAEVARSSLAAPDEAAGALGAESLPRREELVLLVGSERAAAVGSLLRARAGEVLGLAAEGVGTDQPLTALGLDSLGAVELHNRIEEDTGVSLPLADLLEGVSLAELVDRVAQKVGGEEAGAMPEAAPPPAEYPLAAGQRALWFLYKLAPESSAYIISGAARSRGGLDMPALRRAFQALVDRHRALRSTFHGGSGQPLQRVRERVRFEVSEIDARDWSEAAFRDRLEQEAFRPFDLERELPLRVVVLERSDTERVLALAVHHIVADFWSLEVLLSELAVLYRPGAGELPALRPLPLEFADYVRWQQEQLAGPAAEQSWEFWRGCLEGRPQALELPTDRPRPRVQSYRGDGSTFRLPAELSERLEELARSHGATLFMLLAAAIKTLLHRQSGQTDLLLGTPTAGRGSTRVAELVGYFVNPIVLRSDLGGDPSFEALLEQERRVALDAFRHQDFPFPLLVERLEPQRDASRSPIFQVVFALQKARGALGSLAELALGTSGVPIPLGALALESVGLQRPGVQFDLSWVLAQGEAGILGLLQYNSDLFDATTAERLAAHLANLLRGVAEAPAARLSELPLLTAAERHQVLVEWNDPLLEYPEGGSVVELFAAQARQRPDAVAVVFAGRALSYGELAARGGALGRRLRALGVGPESVVGLCGTPSLGMLVGLLGILEAGGAYLPLDPDYPEQRLSLMVNDASVELVVEPADGEEMLPELGCRVVHSDGEEAETALEAGAALPVVLPEHPAYVIYTSGSTGLPKGVMVSHRAVSNRLRFQVAADLEERSRVLQRTKLSFDISVLEIFGPLLAGGQVILPRARERADVARLAELIAEEQITLASFSPSAFALLLETQGEVLAGCRHLEFCGTGGERLSPEIPARFYALMGHREVDFYNRYGPTETTIGVISWKCERDYAGPTVPIGRPIGRARVYLLDPELSPVPLGAPGEIWIGGVCLARGYLGQPGLTADRFLPDPFATTDGVNGVDGVEQGRLYRTGDLARMRPDGAIEFLGRVDEQVKVRGFRVEPGEVAAVLERHPAVARVAVIDREGPDGTLRLVAYVVSAQGTSASAGELRSYLLERVPDYMVPAAFVELAELPLLPTGKVDRRALPEPEWERRAGVLAPRTPAEEMMANLFAEVLGLGGVGLEESFFELGGHSLLATQLVSRVREAFGVELPVRKVFEAPTVAELTRATVGLGSAVAAPPLVPVPRDGGSVLSFAQERLWFLEELEQSLAAYNIPGAIRLTGELGVPALAAAVGEIVRRHEALRTRFVGVEGQPVQIVEPPRRPAIPVIDLSGLAPEAARRLADGLGLAGARRAFDLKTEALLRLRLLRIAPAEHTALITIHHIVSDGWSMGLMVRELEALYRAAVEGAPSPLPELPIQYADFAHWQRGWLAGEVLEGQLAYWRQRLTGAPEVLDLPTDRPRPPVQSFVGRTDTVALSRELTEGLKALARTEGATVFMVLLAAFQTLLYRLTGKPDVVVGSPIANRNRTEVEGLIGFFANTLAFRGDLRGDPDVRTLLARTRDAVLEATSHQDLPFEKLVEDLSPERSLSHTPLFQVLMVLQNAPSKPLELAGLTLEVEGLETGTSKFDLSLSWVERRDRLVGSWEFNTDLFDASTIRRWSGHLERLLEAAVEAPERNVADLPLLRPAEEHHLLWEWNDFAVAPPRQHHAALLFEEQVARTPDAVALALGPERLSYAELNRRANRLAHHLQSLGVRNGSRVGVCVERSFATVISVLSVLKAGAAYVPLDPSYPPERLEFMRSNAGASVLLTQERFLDLLPEREEGDTNLPLDRMPELLEQGPDSNPDLEHDREQLAYVIYTSGSTGWPKGVEMPHKALINLIAWQMRHGVVQGASHTLQFSPLSFDVSFQEMFSTWAAGGTLHMVSEQVRRDAPELLGVIHREGIERLFLAFVALRQLAEVGSERRIYPPALREIIPAGEQLQITDAVAAWAGGLDGCRLENQYGPSETHIVTGYRLHGPPASWPLLPAIGYPIDNTWAYVLDRELRPMPLGVAGEVYLGGDSLARDYRLRPGQTAERILPDPYAGVPGARVYRTGDLGRYDTEGAIEYLGRIDHQVKIRGFRIELGEVEAVLSAHPGVRQAAAKVWEPRTGDKRLVAYVVPEEGSPESWGDQERTVLRDFLGERLPDYMVPSLFVCRASLPLTPSGKVDRRSLPDPETSVVSSAERVPPRGPVEQVVAGIFSDLLKVDPVGRRDSFFDLGGHSLLATQVASRLSRAFGIDLPLRRLFDSPTVAELAAVVEAARAQGASVAPPVVPVPRGAESPTSFGQERLWFFDRLEPDSPVYNMPSAVRLLGVVTAAALGQTLGEIVRRHEVLRTVFALAGSDPVQRVSPPPRWRVPQVDLSRLPEAARRREARHLAAREAARPFELAAGPLLRMALVRLAAEEHMVLLTLHHIVADAWSIGLLIRELAALYPAWTEGRPSPLPELAIQYADFAHWQRGWLAGEVLAERLEAWRRSLAGAPPVLELPTDRPRPAVQSYRGADRRLSLPEPISEGIRGLARRHGATSYMVLLAAFGALLGRYSRQGDLVVGSPVAGRLRPELEDLIGFFINVLPLRVRFAGEDGFETLLGRVRETALEAYTHQDLPFERLVDELEVGRDLSHAPVFQVLFQLLEEPLGGLELPGLQLEPLIGRALTAKYDMVVNVFEEGERWTALWGYNRDLFDETTILRLARHFEALLEGVIAEPQRRLSELPLLDAAERQQLLEWNDTAASFPEACLHELFEAQVARTPEALAVVFEGETLTYAELDGRANHLAHHLRQLGVGPGAFVGVCAERSLELVVALYAVIKAGGAYVPLDPGYPESRLAGMVEDARPAALLVQRRVEALLPRGAAPVVALEDWAEPATEPPMPRPGSRVGLDDPAYMIFTSGSTGRPKGAVNRHRAIVNRLCWMQEAFGLGPEDRVLQKTPFSFDVSVWEFFWPLLVGARLVVARPEGHRDSAYLVDLIRRQGVSTLHFVPSMLAVFLEEPSLADRLSVRRVIVSGEALPADLERRFFERVEGELHNLYGPTEAAVDVTWWPCEPASQRPSVPIGRPVANTRIELLDRELRPVPLGVAGELHIGGVQVGGGYPGRPSLTADRFIPDPSSAQPGARLYRTGDLARSRPGGEVEFLGRIDHQVKVRGFRIELGEIETALLDHPEVREVVVVARGEGGGERQLVAYVVGSRPEPEALTPELRRHLGQRLPDYMVPAAFVHLGELPLTPNGKVDRKALPAPDWRGAGAERVEPRTPLEVRLAELWGEILQIEPVGAEDNFFEMGGNSIRGAVLVNRLQESLGEVIPVVVLFDAPTVAEMAAYLEQQHPAAVEQAWSIPAGAPGQAPASPRHGSLAVPLTAGSWREGEALPLSFAQERLWFLDQLEPGLPTYNIPGVFQVQGELQGSSFAQALGEIVRRHAVLRCRLTASDGSPAQVVGPAATGFPLPVVDLSGLPAAMREAEARRQAAAEARRPFDLGADRLLRVALLRSERREHLALFTMHHIVSDGWSLGVMVRELGELYRAFVAGEPSPLPELAVQYSDYARWQRGWLRGEALEAQIDFWRRTLTEAPVLDLPTDRRRPATTTWRGAVHRFAWPRELRQRTLAVAQEQGASLFMALMAAFAALLGRTSGQRDLTVGTPIAGRNRSELETLIGFFVNTLVIRTDLSGGPGFGALLQRVRQAALGAFGHQDVPFEKVVEELHPKRDPSRTPLFQVMLAVQNARTHQVELPGFQLKPVEVDPGAAHFELTVGVLEGEEGLEGWIEYNTDLFDRTTAIRLERQFRRLLEAATAAPERPVAELPLLSAAEWSQVVVELNDTASTYPREGDLGGLFRQQVERAPDRVALVRDGEHLSYGELARRADALAGYLRSLGVGPDVPVGLCLERSPELLVAILAVLEAGGAYLPLDPAYPAERLAFMVEDTGAPVILTQMGLESALPEPGTGSVQVVRLEEAWPALEVPGSRPARVEVGPDQLAYIMFTSGSTGRPKGVAVTHRNVLRLVLETQFATFSAEEVFLQFAPVSFDAATLEIWGPLLHGGRLVLAPGGAEALDRLGDLLLEEGVSTLWLTAGLFHQVVEQNLPWLGSVRQLLAGGEVLSPAHVRRVLSELPGVTLINGYGPTENTTFTTCHPMRGPGDLSSAVPIGRPIANTRVQVLSPEMLPVPVGVFGELYAAGDGLARGYFNRPALTAERFVPDPFGAPGERLYRTGDRVRWSPDGALDFQGRIDTQIKLRGFRIELGEIEAVLTSHGVVQEAVAVLHRPAPQEAQIVAYFVPQAGAAAAPGELAAELRELCGEHLPAYMVPSILVALDALPLNANGKVDRAALPDPEHPREQGALLAPRTPTEEVVASLFASVLHRDQVGADEDFFDLGGHSLLATQLVSRLRQAFGVELSLQTLFETSRVRELAERLETLQGGASVPPIRRLEQRRDLPLSFAQQRLWLLLQLDPTGPIYNVPAALRLAGPLNVPAFEQALAEILRRHEVLRAVFGLDGEEPVQNLLPARVETLPVVDLTGLAEADRQVERRRLSQLEEQRRFDLARGPLVRAHLVRVRDQDHAVLLTLHHIVIDGWSVSLVRSELVSLYGAFREGAASALAELALQYSDYAAWQRQWLTESELERQIGYWRQRLAEVPPLELPTDRPRPPIQSFQGAVLRQRLGIELIRRLESLGRDQGVTLFMVMLAAYQTLLGRHSRQSDFAVGTPVAGRTREEIEDLVGFFVNTLVLRADLAGNPRFTTLLERVRETALGAYAHQEVPFEKLVEELGVQRDLTRSPLFQTAFVLQNLPRTRAELAGLTLSTLELDDREARYDITLVAIESDEGLELVLTYNVELFDQVRLERFLRQYRALLEALEEAPERPLSALPLLSAAERHQVLHEWSAGELRRPEGLRLHEVMAIHAAERPDGIAVELGSQHFLSYGELDRRAEQLAQTLIERGVGRETPVGMLVEPSLERMVGLYAVLKAGGAFVPLDPQFPEERLLYIVEDTRMPILLTHGSLGDRLPEELWSKRVFLDDPSVYRPVPPGPPPERPGELAYIIYTSGSTGVPNGVLAPHAAVVNMMGDTRERTRMVPGRRFAHHLSFNFDAGVLEFFLPLTSGATVWICPQEDRLPGPELAECFRRQAVTASICTPAILSLIPEGDLPAFEIAIAGGESLLAELAHRWQKRGELQNWYGPTETTMYVTAEGCGERYTREAPIGRPAHNADILILDASMEPVPVGVPGELCVGGAGLAWGYLNRPRLTAQRFVPHPFGEAAGPRTPGSRLYRTGDLARHLPDGRVEFLSRIDHQVKLHGLRIELGEVETALMRHPAVREAVAAVVSGVGGKRLVAYVSVGSEAAAGDTSRLEAELAELLEEKLPSYMVPSAMAFLDELPRAPTGKADRKALAAIPVGATRAGTLVPPRDETELALAKMWEDLLETSPVGVEDNFFNLGGHSLLAVRLASRIRQSFGLELPLATLFQAPTIQEQAVLIRRGSSGETRWSPLLPLHTSDGGRPFFCVHAIGGSAFAYRDLALALGSEYEFYGLQSRGMSPGQQPHRRIEEMAAAYAEAVRRVAPRGPYCLGGWSFGGYIALEMARRFQAEGEEVAFVALIDTAGIDPEYKPPEWEDVYALSFLARDLGGLAACELNIPDEELKQIDPEKRLDHILDRAREVGALPEDADPEQIHRLAALFQANLESLYPYQPEVYDGRLHLFLAEDGLAREMAAAWPKVAKGGVVTRMLEGDHYSVLRPPRVEKLASALRELMAGVKAAPASGGGSREPEPVPQHAAPRNLRES